LAQGFLAHRRGERDALAAAVAAAGVAEEPAAAQAPGVLLLCAHAGAALPEWALASLPAAEPARARAALARLRELGVGDGLDAVARAIEAAASLRAALQIVQANVPALLARAEPAVLAAGGDLLLWHPDGPGAGRGGIGPPREVVASLAGEDLLGPLVSLSVGGPHGEGARMVVEPAVAVVPRHEVNVARPW
jgi:hypothetical protein